MKKIKVKAKFLLNKEYYLLYFLLIIVFISRHLLIKDGLVPFQFDHGKDSLAVLDMWLNKNPKLVGPWTSIPGLYFGPGWYYLILPSFLLGAWHPLSPVYLMTFLLMLQVMLAYRYLGKEEAILMATAPLWIMISTSAWNPFPMTFISLVILIIIKEFKKSKEVQSIKLFIMALVAALAFHFSTAFAIFYPILILFSLYQHRIKLDCKKILTMLVGYLIPFIPQMIFELRHNFIELRAVLAYLQSGQTQSFNFAKMQTVLKTIYDDFKFAVIPSTHFPNLEIFDHLFLIFFILLAVSAFFTKRANRIKTTGFKLTLTAEYLFWPVLALIGYSFLHFNIWYVLALTPLFVMFAGDVLRAQSKIVRSTYLVLMFISLFLKVDYFLSTNQYQLSQASSFLSPKINAINLIRSDANGQAFNSYHYAPDIYDFPYQYLYFWQALNGQPLPVEFTYQKGETNYIVQKKELLNYFSEQQMSGDAAISYFIVEPAAVKQFQDNWWGNFGIKDPASLEKLPSTSALEIYKYKLN